MTSTSSQLILPSIQNNAYTLNKRGKPPLIPNYHYTRNLNPTSISHNTINNENKPYNYSLMKFNNRSQSANSKRNTNANYNNKIPNNHLYLSNEIMSKSMIKQYNNEKMYIDTVLSKDHHKLKQENDAIHNEFTKQQQYNEYLDYKRIGERNQLVSLNNDILAMQIKQKRLLSLKKQKERSNSMTELKERINRENVIYELEKNKNERIQYFYKKELETQIVVQLINKIEKDEMSNRSRIKNRLLLKDYIDTLNKDNCSNIYNIHYD